jgi:hypothetical protein
MAAPRGKVLVANFIADGRDKNVVQFFPSDVGAVKSVLGAGAEDRV